MTHDDPAPGTADSRGSPEAVCATFKGISGFERECFGNIASLGAVLRSSCLSRRRPKCAAERRIGAVQGSIGAKALFDDEELTQIKGQRAARLRAGPTRFSRAAAHLTSFQYRKRNPAVLARLLFTKKLFDNPPLNSVCMRPT